MTLRAAFGYSRLSVAFVCTVALVARFFWGLGTGTFTAGNYFGYLTIQSNMVFVVVSVLAGVRALRTAVDPRWLTTLRAIVLSCTVSAGIVFAVLIEQAGQRGFRIDVPWSDILLHFVLPAIAILDWVVAPGRGRSLWRSLAFVLAYPVLWGIVTLVRGRIVGWYPYFFLDPAQVDFAQFAFFSGLAMTLFAIVSTSIVMLSRIPPLGDSDRPLRGR
jgi:hypothetical protein